MNKFSGEFKQKKQSSLGYMNERALKPCLSAINQVSHLCVFVHPNWAVNKQIPHAIYCESEFELNPALSLWSTSQIKAENLIQQLGSD